MLLAAGLALAFASLRAATGTTQRGEAMAQRNEHMRAAEGFLRRRIGGARPIGFGTDPDSGTQLFFIGEARRMRFVADLPDYLGRGGPHLHDLSIEDAGIGTSSGVSIKVALTMVQAGEVMPEEPPRPPEVLSEALADARFRYRGFGDDGKLGDWQDTWASAERMPLQVQVLARDANGRDWPPLVVALPLATGQLGVGGQ